MPDYVATTPGLFPLPDWSKDTLSDLKGHQKHDLISGDESADIVEVYATAREEVIKTQHDANLDRIVEGQLRWDDMLAHPLCVHDAVETRGLLRYYDNNNFYREPVVTGELTPDGDIAQELEAATELTGDLQAVLPGPYSLFDLATNEYYGNDQAFLTGLTEFLTAEADACPPVESAILLEPSLVTNPPDNGLVTRAVEAIDTVATAIEAPVITHTYWGSLTETIHAELLDTAIDAIGYDLVTAPEASANLVAEYGSTTKVALGVVDGQNTRIESPETIRTRIDDFLDQTDTPDTVFITSNTEMFYLPVSKFTAKLEALGAATTEAIA